MTEDPSPKATAIDEPPKPGKGWLGRVQVSPLDLLKVTGGFAVLASLLMHLVGTAASDAYLREWGVEITLFPRGVDRIQIDGYLWLLVSGVKLWVVVLENAVELLLLAGVVVLYWMLLTGLSSTGGDSAAPAWLARVRPWVTTLVRSTAIYVLVVAGLVLTVAATYLASVALAQPFVLADRLGREHAQSHRTAFEKGCRANTRPQCFELRRGSERIARGLLIDSSAEHIAFFDVDTGRVRVLPRKDLEYSVVGP